METIKEFLRGICACLAAARMYPVTHPQVKDVIDEVYAHLEEIFQGRDELIIGLVEDEIIFDNQVLFDLSIMMQQLVDHCKKKGIEKIYFYENVKKEELVKLITFLLTPPEEKDKDVDVQEQLSMQGVNNIRVSSLTTPLEEGSKKDPETFERAYEKLLEELSVHFQKMLSAEQESEAQEESNVYADLKHVIFNIFQNYKGKYQEIINLNVSEKFKLPLTHSVNVSLLAMEFSVGLDFSEEEMLDVGLAALLHDIGVFQRSEEKKPPSSQAEKESYIEETARSGAEILLKFTEEMGVLPLVVAFEHSLRYDLQKKEGENTCHLASMMVAVCNHYDNLVREEREKQNYSPDKLYDLIVKESEGIFYPELLEKFFKVIGVWPVGSILSLSDGKIAIVREENEGDMFLPKVEIVFPQEDNRVVDLKEKEISIESYLDPRKEGRKYLHLL